MDRLESLMSAKILGELIEKRVAIGINSSTDSFCERADVILVQGRISKVEIDPERYNNVCHLTETPNPFYDSFPTSLVMTVETLE